MMDRVLVFLKRIAKYLSFIFLAISVIVLILTTIKIVENQDIPNATKNRLELKVKQETDELSRKLKSLESFTSRLDTVVLKPFFNNKLDYAKDTAIVRKKIG